MAPRANKAWLAAAALVLTALLLGALLLWPRGTGERPSHAEIARPPALEVDAAELKATVVTPHLEEPILAGKNILWCSTFQLAWNELCALIGEDVHMADEHPMVAVLNKKTATKEHLDDASYVALAGYVGDGIVEKIDKALLAKFEGAASPKLFPPPVSLGPDALVAYAYLFKALRFRWSFERLRSPLRFGDREVESFGFVQLTREMKRLGTQVVIVDYKGKYAHMPEVDSDDFIIELKTVSKGDRLFLAKVAPAGTLGETVASVQARIRGAAPKTVAGKERLEIPVLDLDITRPYDELCRKPLRCKEPRANGQGIAIADQTVRFRLNEQGAVLKSEGMMAGGIGHTMVFDKPFLILMQRADADVPYFALWVDNAELLVPWQGRPGSRAKEPQE